MDIDTLLALFTSTDDTEQLSQLGGYDFSNEAAENALAITTLDPDDPKAIAFWTGYFARAACDPDSDLQVIAFHIYECRHWLRPVADRVFTAIRGAVPDSLLRALNA